MYICEQSDSAEKTKALWRFNINISRQKTQYNPKTHLKNIQLKWSSTKFWKTMHFCYYFWYRTVCDMDVQSLSHVQKCYVCFCVEKMFIVCSSFVVPWIIVQKSVSVALMWKSSLIQDEAELSSFVDTDVLQQLQDPFGVKGSFICILAETKDVFAEVSIDRT